MKRQYWQPVLFLLVAIGVIGGFIGYGEWEFNQLPHFKVIVNKDKANLARNLVLEGNVFYTGRIQDKMPIQGENFVLTPQQGSVYTEQKGFGRPLSQRMALSKKVVDLLSKSEQNRFDQGLGVHVASRREETVYWWTDPLREKEVHVIFYDRQKDQARRVALPMKEMGFSSIYCQKVVRWGESYHFIGEGQRTGEQGASRGGTQYYDIQVKKGYRNGDRLPVKVLDDKAFTGLQGDETLHYFKEKEEAFVLVNAQEDQAKSPFKLVSLASGKEAPIELKGNHALGQIGPVIYAVDATEGETHFISWTSQVKDGKVQLTKQQDRPYALGAGVYVDGDLLTLHGKGNSNGRQRTWSFKRLDVVTGEVIEDLTISCDNFDQETYDDIYVYQK